jgi:hypothetical protein
MKEVLFYRTFKKFQGGHLKVWDYFQHVLSSPNYTAKVRFSADSVWDERNPWRDMRSDVIGPDTPANPDILFIGGTDWRRLPAMPFSITARSGSATARRPPNRFAPRVE